MTLRLVPPPFPLRSPKPVELPKTWDEALLNLRRAHQTAVGDRAMTTDRDNALREAVLKAIPVRSDWVATMPTSAVDARERLADAIVDAVLAVLDEEWGVRYDDDDEVVVTAYALTDGETPEQVAREVAARNRHRTVVSRHVTDWQAVPDGET